MPDPRVAVVIPCHDDGATLPGALASLEQQEPHELVIVDDGSTDSQTLAVLAELEQRAIRVVRQENAGPGPARTAGVQATSAPYVFPLDADDELVPGALAALADALDAEPSADAAWGDIEVFGELETTLEAAPGLDPWLLTYVNDVPAWALFRREPLLAAGGWPALHGDEDWDLWLAYAETGRRGIRVPLVTVRYRRHTGRRGAQALARYDEQVQELRARHPRLFSERAANRRRSPAPVRLKLAYPAIDRLGLLSPHGRYRLYLFLRRPRQLLRFRRLRRAAERRVSRGAAAS